MKPPPARVTRVGKRNQVTIPADFLRHLAVAAGEPVEIVEANGEIRIRKASDPVEHAYGLLRRPGQPPLTIEEIEEATAAAHEAAASARYARVSKRG